MTHVVSPRLAAVAKALPPSRLSTDELLDAGRGHLSDKLVDMLLRMGVETRYSLLANFPDMLFRGADPEPLVGATELVVGAARECLEKASVPVESIGLVLGVSSSPGRLMPSLVCEALAQMPELPRDVANLSIQYMGCSAMSKVVETARWYLTCEPAKHVLVLFMDAVTPLSPPLAGHYSHFSELPKEQRQSTVDVMHGFLFGDAAVAMVFGAGSPGPAFGPVSSLTNEKPEDAELGTVPDGGADVPVVHGRRLYTLSPDVTPRGAHYARRTVANLLAAGGELADPADAVTLLMHTGSTRILDGLCTELGVSPSSPAVASSYQVLRDYGNTIGCSVPLMLAEPVYRDEGVGLVLAFGLSFSCGAFTMTVPEGGWKP
ncbi:3-oxoacyl-[acyl-carrier-protein] synthase III C-terminal domain-containing protein [Lentzea sp. NPDC059081]|uniref:3-oxoacyl-[acyl-carrier-protein] synthase III C-terminal domain-containing protein n=1 Tax=Lentzea sp. NPDC059081 TaxID=3346719 RepID=UPI003689C84A